jgi:hypothetical protein
MLLYRRALLVVAALLFLWVQALAPTHRIEHRSASGQQTVGAATIASASDHWGHDQNEPVCSLFDALAAADAVGCESTPLFDALVFASLFLTFISAAVALRARRANARAPPRSI